MGFFLQLKILLWKNFTLKRRNLYVVLLEIFIPLVLFMILTVIRMKEPSKQVPDSYFHARPLPSSGVFAILEEFCDGGTIDDQGFHHFQNSSAHKLLEKLNHLALKDNFFEPGFSPQDMDDFPDLFQTLVEGFVTLHDNSKDMKDVQLSSIFNDQEHLENVLKNMSISSDLIDVLFTSKLSAKELLGFFLEGDETSNAMNRQKRSTENYNTVIDAKTSKVDSPNISQNSETHDEIDAHPNSGNDGDVKPKLDDEIPNLAPRNLVTLFKALFLSPKSINYLTCDNQRFSRLLDRNGKNNSMTMMILQELLCNMTTTQSHVFSKVLLRNVNLESILKELGLAELKLPTGFTDGKFDVNFKKFMQLKQDIVDLSQFGSLIPQNACQDEKEDYIDKAENATTKRPHSKKKTSPSKKAGAGLLKVLISMQKTICGRHAFPKDKMKIFEKTMDPADLGISGDVQAHLYLLSRVLYNNPKVLYAPVGTEADLVIKDANQTFILLDSITQYAKKWLKVSADTKKYLNRNETSDNLNLIWEAQQELSNIYNLCNIFDIPGLETFNSTTRPYQDILIQLLDTMDNVACSWLSLIGGLSFDVFQGFKTEEELVDYVLTEAYDDGVTVVASVVFTNMNDDGTLPPHVVYKLRQNATFTPNTQNIRDKYWYPGPGFQKDDYYHLGFVWIQDIVERSIINTQVGKDVVEPGTYVQETPYPCYSKDTFMAMIAHAMPLCLTSSWVYTVAMLVQSIVYEKEHRLKEVMRMMGLNNSVHWLAWFLTLFVQMTATMGILTTMLKFGSVLQHSNAFIIFLVLEIFAIATMSFSFLISACFSKAKLAAACAGIIYFLSYIPYLYVSLGEGVAHERVPSWMKCVSSLFSTTAFGLGAKYFAYYEIQGVGVQWSNMNKSPVRNDQFNLMWVCFMLVLDTFIYGIFTWYIENVHPGAFGLPKPWYFPFLKSYWSGQLLSTESHTCSLRSCMRCKGRDPYYIMDEEYNSENAADSRSFEREPNDLPQGVCIDHLKKIYKNGKCAIKNLSLNCYEGQITSLVGHNGAGKTTLLSILTGLFPSTGGSATINGLDIRADMEKIRKNIGMCPQHNVLFEKLTVEEHIWFYARIKGLSKESTTEEIERMLLDVGLPQKRHNKVECLSGGMKRKLSIAIAFVAGSKTVILDEPTSGVDPYARRAIWDLLLKYKKGRTIILSTHHMDEADILGDRVAIISHGQVKCCGSSLFLKNTFGQGYHMNIVKRNDFEEDLSGAHSQSLKAQCTEIRLTEFVKQYVSTAYLKFESQQELHYILPFEEVKERRFENLFHNLDKNLDMLQISSYGVMDTTLEEVFLLVTKIEQKHREDNENIPTEASVSGIQLHTRVGIENRTHSRESSSDSNVFNIPGHVTQSGHTRNGSTDSILSNKASVSGIQLHMRVGIENRTHSRESSSDSNVFNIPGHVTQSGHTRNNSTDSILSKKHTNQYIKLESKITTTSKLSNKKGLIEEKSNSLIDDMESPKNVGGRKLAYQFFAVILKRFTYIRRNRKGLFSQIVLPSIFVCIAMTVGLAVPKVKDLPPLVLSPLQYINLSQPEGNHIPFANEARNNPEPEWSTDAGPSELVQTFRLPSGVGSACVVQSASKLDSKQEANLTHKDFIDTKRFFGPQCRSVYVNKPQTRENTINANVHWDIRLGHRTWLKNYPKCHCSKEESNVICDYKNYNGPPSFKMMSGDILQDITGSNQTEFYLLTSDLHKLNRYGGFSFGNQRKIVPKDFGKNAPISFQKLAVRNVAKVWYNIKGFHSMPTYLNSINNAILRANIPKSKTNPAQYGITAINHPMNDTNVDLSWDAILQGTNVLISIFIIVAMSFVPASFVLFLVYERSIKAKHLQFVSGINPVVYWLANYCWDVCNYMVPCLCCIIILRIFDIPSYASSTNYPAVVSLFFMYGVSMTPMMYPASFWFEEPSSAYICLIIINLFLGVTTLTTSYLLDIVNHHDKGFGIYHDILENCFLVFPNYCLGRGLMDIGFNEYHNEYWFRLGAYDLMKSPFDWSLIPRNLIAMATMGFVFFIITLLCEVNFFCKPKRLPINPLMTPNDEDEDVANERKRVLKGSGRRDLFRLENLTKIYESKKLGQNLAVDRLCLGIPAGECFGLLGVNGAGKTTAFRMLTGDLPLTGGDAHLQGHSIIHDLMKVQQKIGYCPQFDALYNELTPREHLKFYARIRGIPRSEQARVVESGLQDLNLNEYSDKLVRNLSGGNKRKLSAAIALLGNPPILFMDEPTTGMDPHSRRFLWDLILGLIKGGRSVILTSHSMEECEALCTRLAIMVNGRFKCLGSSQHLKTRFGDGYTIGLRIKGPNIEKERQKVMRFMNRNFSSCVLKESHYNKLKYEIKPDELNLSQLFAKMEEAKTNLNVEDYSISQNTLDNVFINFVKQDTELVQELATALPERNTCNIISELQSLVTGIEDDENMDLAVI